MFKLTLISLVLFITTLINLVVLHVSWNRKNSSAGLYFSLAMIGIVIWSLGGAFDYAVTQLSLKIIFSKIEAIGYLSAIPLFALTSLAIAGNELWLQQRWLRAIFIFIPLGSILIVLTNEWHGWMWISFEQTPDNLFLFERGNAYKWILIIYYSFLAFILGNLWFAIHKSSGYARQQARLMMFAALLPLFTNILYQGRFSHIKGVDWSAVTFSVSSLIFLYALYGLRFLDIIHIARDNIIEQMDDNVLVVDGLGRLADFNPAAATLLGMTRKEIWKPVEQTVLARYPEVKSILLGKTTFAREISLGGKLFDVRRSPLEDQRGWQYGYMLVLRDISERAQQDAKLREAHAQVAKEEERQQLARDLHDSVNQSIHSIILFADTLKDLLNKNKIEQANELSERIQESSQQALKETRLLLYKTQLIQPGAAPNLYTMLEDRLNMVERRSGIQAQIKGDWSALANYPAAYCENLYWISMEALNNSLNYAHAKHVSVSFMDTASALELDITDDGQGFDLNHIRAGGFGMRSMHARAEQLGGILTLTSTPGNGTRIFIKIPKNDNGEVLCPPLQS